MISLLLAMAMMAQDPASPDAAKSVAGVSPPPAAQAAVPTKAQKGGNSTDTFCRNEAPMGTRIPKKRCYNAQEFKLRQMDERKNLDRIQADARAPISR
jgi:hypothetical protein